jgi:hypothetical protein
VRTVAIPGWGKWRISAWMTAACIEDGSMLRAVSKGGTVKKNTSGRAVRSVVDQSAPGDPDRELETTSHESI